MNDGAAALIMMDTGEAAARGLRPLARVLGTAVSACSPEVMGLAPIQASRRVLSGLGIGPNDLDHVEINEAFAAQVIPCYQQLGFDVEKVNPFGGAIALGHPFGMTGARILGTLVQGLRARDGELGLATLCAAGGQGLAVVVQRAD